MRIADSVAMYVDLDRDPDSPRSQYTPCCDWVAAVLRTAAGAQDSWHYRRGGPWWQEACVWDAADPMSPMRAYASLARHAEWLAEPPRCEGNAAQAEALIREHGRGWYAIQAWRRNGTGHQFLLGHAGECKGFLADSSASRPSRRRWCDFAQYLRRYYTIGVVAVYLEERSCPKAA